MSFAVTSHGPSLSMRTVWVFAVCETQTTSLRFKMISVTSSTTSGTCVNSWSAPSIFTAVMAAP